MTLVALSLVGAGCFLVGWSWARISQAYRDADARARANRDRLVRMRVRRQVAAKRSEMAAHRRRDRALAQAALAFCRDRPSA